MINKKKKNILGQSNPLTELLRNSKRQVGSEMESVHFVQNPITNSKSQLSCYLSDISIT